jgi:pyruvate/2-oxoglutarate dehydrogenase complex dihydrolipoamide dehydrogenase (E3) component
MRESEAQVGRRIMIRTRSTMRVGRTVEKGEAMGFMKIMADAGTSKILAAAMLGPGGDEMVHSILDAVNADVPCPRLHWAAPIHPTVSELSPTVLGGMKRVA